MKKALTVFFLIASMVVARSQVATKDKPKIPFPKDTTRLLSVEPDIIYDSLFIARGKFRTYKKNVHASYYHNKFNGRRTASGRKFDNSKYTAAHRKLPFGTILKVTNEQNGKFVIVEITDRGPFSRGREIDLSRKAFMDITSNKNSGAMLVKMEIVN